MPDLPVTAQVRALATASHNIGGHQINLRAGDEMTITFPSWAHLEFLVHTGALETDLVPTPAQPIVIIMNG